MAITGIREMSTITTPPEERHPVLTYVGAYEDRQVIAAIRRELLREGQVFYIHNRVQSIEKAAARIRELVPEARVATAHGQMGEHQLEQVMLDFWEKRFDVLVCTTIVESGLDVSNANTMIIERADTLGLSQLHQLRGRVGRGRERAYAYFLYPPDKPLTETAHERLATLAQHSDLGGGMAIAMKDLEIRGAGNLLGGEQSGHIADVGFDLYVRLVGEAVARVPRRRRAPEPAEVKIELPVDAHLPHDYVPSERLRLEMYKRLAEVRADEDVDLIREELRRPLRRAAGRGRQRCSQVARFRARARQAGLTDVTIAGQVRPVRAGRAARLARRCGSTGSTRRASSRPRCVRCSCPARSTAVVGGQPIRDEALLAWAREVIDTVDRPRRRTRRSRSELGSTRRRVTVTRSRTVQAVRRSRPRGARAARRAACTPAPPRWSADESISDSRVDDVASALCAAQGAQARAAGQDLASRGARQGALDVLIDSALSRQFGASQGVQPDQEQVSAALAANAQNISGLPAEQRQDVQGHAAGVRRGPADAHRGRPARAREDRHEERHRAAGASPRAPSCATPGPPRTPTSTVDPRFGDVRQERPAARERFALGRRVAVRHRRRQRRPVAGLGRRAAGQPEVQLTLLVTSPRVAPGLLSWSAWSAIAAAPRRLASSPTHRSRAPSSRRATRSTYSRRRR